MEDGKIRIDQDIEKSVPGKESKVNKGHELRLNLLLWANGELSLVRQKVWLGEPEGGPWGLLVEAF